MGIEAVSYKVTFEYMSIPLVDERSPTRAVLLPEEAFLRDGPQAMPAWFSLPEGAEELVIPHNERLRPNSPRELTCVLRGVPHARREPETDALVTHKCLPRKDLAASEVEAAQSQRRWWLGCHGVDDVKIRRAGQCHGRSLHHQEQHDQLDERHMEALDH